MATLTQLILDADGTIATTEIDHDAGTGSPYYTHCDDAPDGGSSEWVSNDGDTGQAASMAAWFRLSDVDADFGSMDTLNIDVDVQASSVSDDAMTLSAQIFDSDSGGSENALTDSQQVGDETDTTRVQRNVPFGSLTGSKAQWNGAYIRFTWTYTKTGSWDNAELHLFGCDIDGTYTASGGITVPRMSHHYSKNILAGR